MAFGNAIVRAIKITKRRPLFTVGILSFNFSGANFVNDGCIWAILHLFLIGGVGGVTKVANRHRALM